MTPDLTPTTLEGKHVRLVPLTAAHSDALLAAAGDGELWNSKVTVVPARYTVGEYIDEALMGQAQGRELPFVIVRKRQPELAASNADQVVGTTRFYDIACSGSNVIKAAIGYTWVSRSAQRTAVNTEAKLLLLTYAFETWRAIRVEFITDVLNEQSRAAILRLGAKEEGILRNHLLMPDGRIRDSMCFSIIASEWPDVKAALTSKLANFAGQ